MEFLDFSPPPIPTRIQQQDALQKGVGRAVTWAERGQLDLDVLLEACLHDQRFDRQCEANRGEWLCFNAGSSATGGTILLSLLLTFFSWIDQ